MDRAPVPDVPGLFAEAVRHAQAGREAEAEQGYRRVLALRPEAAEAHFNLGNALVRQQRLDEAAESFRRAVAARPGYWEAHCHLGNALRDRFLLDEAIDSFRAAIALNPGFAELHRNLSVALRDHGRLAEAVASARTAVALAPDLAEAHFHLALALLSQGELAEGFFHYEWRWRTAEMRAAPRRQPQWRGEAGAGRTLLLHAEQGFGDTLQFCRFAAVAAARGFAVVLQVQQTLVPLLRDLPGVARVIGQGEEPGKHDLHCPLLSAPLAAGISLATVPSATAYLRADPARAEAIGRRLPRGPRVGLAWAGNATPAFDRRRSIAPERLAPLFEVAGVRFVSLQKDGPPAPAGAPLTDLMPEMRNFADTAALIENLDLVISVDTAVVHLAAALGKPVWMLDRSDHCWRWLDGRADSPWYPTLRIHRQRRIGEWDPVIADAARDLRELVG